MSFLRSKLIILRYRCIHYESLWFNLSVWRNRVKSKLFLAINSTHLFLLFKNHSCRLLSVNPPRESSNLFIAPPCRVEALRKEGLRSSRHFSRHRHFIGSLSVSPNYFWFLQYYSFSLSLCEIISWCKMFCVVLFEVTMMVLGGHICGRSWRLVKPLVLRFFVFHF